MDTYLKWKKQPRVLWSNTFLCRKNPHIFTRTHIECKQKFPQMNTVSPDWEETYSLLIQLQGPQTSQLHGTWRWWRSVVSDSLRPMGSSAHGGLQAGILEWVAISFSRGFFYPGIEPEYSGSPALAGRFFTNWAIREHTYTHACTDLF